MKAGYLFLILLGLQATSVVAMPPVTPKKTVADTYHGTRVTDDYRWLEDWKDPEVQRWSEAQNAHARAFLDGLPSVAAIRRQVTQIMMAENVSYSAIAYRPGMLFAMKRQPPKQQPLLVVMPSADAPDEARILVDPNALDQAGTTSIDWHEPSPDGKLIAVSLSHGGSEAGDVHVFETATGRELYEVVPRVNTGTAGGDLAWMPDSSGFFYTRHPRVGERPDADLDFFQQVYFHKLGTPTAEDRYELGKDFPRVAEIELEMHSGGTLLAMVQNGDGGQFAHYLRLPGGEWRQFATFEDQIVQSTFGTKNDLVLVSRQQAPRGKILRLSLSHLELKDAKLLVPEGPEAIVTSFYHHPPTVLETGNRLYVVYQLGGPSELRVFDPAGKPLERPKQLAAAAVGGLTKLEGDDLLFSNTSFVEPHAYYRLRAQANVTEKTTLATNSPVDFSSIEVVREFATSKDGAKVPVTILMSRGTKLDGTNPAVVTGYGGYGINITPGFNPVKGVLLKQGFVVAVANLRGGGEFGESWHRQGNLTHKQNVFDDFAAVLQHLIQRRYTSSSKLAIEGGSNGGLLMGATMTQHPELVRAVVSHVGIYDMLRVELSPNGSFNIVEFGTVKNHDHFLALYGYSPYHKVVDGTWYPSLLLLTGANDSRVDPMQSRKMAARMQAATASVEPVLLRTSSNSGHGAGTALAERIEQTVDVYAFLFDRLGIACRESN